MDKAKKKAHHENIEDDGEDLDIGSTEDLKKKIKERFFEACKKGNCETILKSFNNELLDVLEVDDNKWSALQWAVVNNHPEAVKIVYAKVKELEALQEKTKKNKETDQKFTQELNEFDEAFQKPLNPADNGKYTPLHWSAYKGFDVISSILLKMGCDPMQVDKYGDNALHQAAAGNHYETFKLFMGLGIDLDYKNSRSHKAIDLTTNKKIEDLINKALKTKFCTICNKIFDFDNKRYLCSIKEDIICKNCCVIDYYYATEDAEEKDIRDCRCKNCQKEIKEAEDNLQAAIDSNDLETLKKQFDESIKFKIDLHLKKSAVLQKDKLTREKEVRELLDSLKVVENHKTIIKSVYELDQKLKSAEENNVKLDETLIQRAAHEKERLLAEKELRQLLSNITIDMASKENLDNLSQKVETAKNTGVSEEYVNKGVDLAEKFKLNIDAKDILQKFLEYPIREYPVVEEVDPKKKKKAEPPPKKKKKKKEPPFLVPEWAKELNVLIEKVADMKKYVAKAEELGLNEEFVKTTKEQLKRFAKEIPFRKEEEETLRKLEEEKLAKKNKKKGKK